MKKILTGILLVFLFSAIFAGTQALIIPATETTGGDLSDAVNFAIYMDIPGIDGESTDKDYKDWIEILSYSSGVSQPTTGTGATRRKGDVILEDIVLAKFVDKATPKLMEATADGTVFNEVEIDIVRMIGEAPASFYHYTLENVMVTSYRSQGSVLEDPYPWDTFTLSYEGITVIYTQYSSSGLPQGNVEWNYH